MRSLTLDRCVDRRPTRQWPFREHARGEVYEDCRTTLVTAVLTAFHCDRSGRRRAVRRRGFGLEANDTTPSVVCLVAVY
jgi:hypothetical protein